MAKAAVGSTEKALKWIRKQGGVIRTGEALEAGIHPRTLYRLRAEGILETVSRGVYRLASLKPVSDPDLFTVASRIPQGVICLISALSFHDITTQIPRKVYIALEKGARTPQLNYPPLVVHHFTGSAFREGVDKHTVDEASVKIYNPEKTIADCFKFRNQVGMDVVLEALRLYKSRRKVNFQKLLYYARICRVEKIMKPYLESIT